MRRVNLALTAAFLLSLAGISNYALGAPVSVNVNTMHQKISGFGTCSAWNGTLDPSIARQLWSTTDGAGLSLHRVMIDRDGLSDDETNNAITANSYGVKVWGTPWFCKNGVKVTHTEFNPITGKIDTVRYDTLYEKDYQEWADTLAATANNLKKKGVSLYAISSGNEIDLGWTFYDKQALANWVGKYMGPTLAAKAPDTKVIGVETCNWWGFDGYYNYFKNDPDAWKYSSILATHEYGGSPQAYPAIQQAGKEFWETEKYDPQTDVEDPGMGSALRVSKIIHEALTVANMNAWHYWWIFPCQNCANGSLCAEGTKIMTKRLWIMGNYSRYVRPGFVRVEATTDPTSAVNISAFRDSALNRVVIVAINENTNSISQDFSIPGTTPIQLTPCITDPTRDLVEQSVQTLTSSSFTYSLPAQSVTSLIIDLKIVPVEPRPVEPRSAFTKIEAESYNLQSGTKVEECTEGGDDIGFIENGDYAVYRSIDFGNGAEGFQARVAAANSGGNIQIILNSITGPVAGTCQVSSTGGWQTWKTAIGDINEISGKHDLYLKFTGGTGYLFNLNWFQFTSGTGITEKNIRYFKKANFTTGISGGKIVITPIDKNNRYSFSVYRSDGQLVTGRANVTGRVTVLAKSKGVYFININSKQHVENKRVTVY